VLLEKLFLNSRQKEYNHEEPKRVYPDRTFGGDRYYCAIDGDIDACPEPREETGTVGFLPGEAETMGPYVQVIYR
jgi:hypothetical protein